MELNKYEKEILKCISFIRNNEFTLENVKSFSSRLTGIFKGENIDSLIQNSLVSLCDKNLIKKIAEEKYTKLFDNKAINHSLNYKGSDSEMVKSLTNDLTLCDLHEDGA